MIRTKLTNPGIADRLERDVADYLSPFGFRLERRHRWAKREGEPPPSPDGAGPGGRADDAADAEAVLTAPRPPRYYPLDGETPSSSGGDSPVDNFRKGCDSLPRSIAARPREDDTASADAAGPFGTLHLHAREESVLSTVGPLLRTYLRLSSHHISPLRLRSIVRCDFVIDPLEKWGKMNSEQRQIHLRRQEDRSIRRMVHHIHMLVRNSMGSALCIDLIVVLPRYRRRDSGGSISKEVPLTVSSIRREMIDNPDACYPSVRLLEQCDVAHCIGNETCDRHHSRVMHVEVETRMCTVRATPALFRWLHFLEYPVGDGNNVAPCQGGIVTSERGQSEFTAWTPLIVACIEKVANLHRILMLCHSFDKVHHVCGDVSCCGARDDRKSSSERTLMSNLVVVLPNSSTKAHNGNPSNENEGVINCELLREFEDAFDHFCGVVVKNGKGSDGGSGLVHRPTFVHEGHATDKILAAIERRRQSHPYRAMLLSPPSVIGIDLHPSALALEGHCPTNPSPALLKIRGADALVFGYESTGIPDIVVEGINEWVQIPSRSSINVVAAMSIVLDTMLG